MFSLLANKKPLLNKKSFIAPNATIIGAVTLEENSSVWYNAVLRADIAEIILGKNSNIQDGCVCHVDFDKPVIIGENVTIGHNAVLHGCTIGNNTLIGMGAIILDGAVIGDNCIVGAGALVLQNSVIPAYSLVLGNPAKIKKTISDIEIQRVIENAKNYVLLSKEHGGLKYE